MEYGRPRAAVLLMDTLRVFKPRFNYLLERFYYLCELCVGLGLISFSFIVGPWLREGEYGPSTSFVPSICTSLLLSHSL